MIERHIVAGLMCGSSLDGVDVAIVQFDLELSGSAAGIVSWELLEYREYEIPIELGSTLKQMRILSSHEVFQLDAKLAQYFSECLSQSENNFSLAGIHGVTLFHLPASNISVQLGNGAICSSILKKTVVGDFRKQDLAAGGKGTPMAILADKYLFPGYDYYLNIGGIANLSNGQNLAFDVCPANQALNYFANKQGRDFDKDGELAKSGAIDQKLYETLNSWLYYSSSPPKSLDNQQIQDQFLTFITEETSPSTALATICEHIAFQVSVHPSIGTTRKLRMLCTGGGVQNTYLMERISHHLSKKNVFCEVPDSITLKGKEAVLIALAALFRYKNIPNFISKASGASRDVCAGALYVG